MSRPFGQLHPGFADAVREWGDDWRRMGALCHARAGRSNHAHAMGMATGHVSDEARERLYMLECELHLADAPR